MWRQVDACCVICHAPLIHASSGVFYCPYERADMEERARKIITSPSLAIAVGRGRGNSPLCPLPSHLVAMERSQRRVNRLTA